MAVHTPPTPPAIVAPVDLALDSASVPDVVRALCQVTDHPRYAMSPEIVANASKLTIALAGPPADVWADGVKALALAGVQAKCAAGLCSFSPLPSAPPPEKHDPPSAVFTYRPVHRDVAFLSAALTGMFPGWHFAGAAAGQQSASGQAVSASSGSGGGGGAGGRAEPAQSVPVQLVGLGPAADRAHLLSVLAELDRPVSSMAVHLAVYEVDVSKTDQSALTLVGKVLGSAFQLGGSVASGLATGGAFGLTVKAGDFSAVVGALDSASQAHLVTSPVLRTSSGVMASFAVGDSVPTLGSVSYSGNSSTPIQSIQYQQSGVVFSVVPELVGDQVDVALYQSISSFVPTSVGVTSSPTLQNRVLSSDLIVRPGSVVVLGGLMQTSDTKGSSGWWLAPRLTRSDQAARTELVLVLSVDVDRP